LTLSRSYKWTSMVNQGQGKSEMKYSLIKRCCTIYRLTVSVQINLTLDLGCQSNSLLAEKKTAPNMHDQERV